MKGKKKRFIILGSFVILAIVYLVYSGIRESMLYYYTVSEVKANANQLYGQGIRISGRVVEGSIHWNSKTSEATFKIADAQESLDVVYKDVLPDAFGEGREVVLEGKYTPGGIFIATNLLTKCPSKYVPEI